MMWHWKGLFKSYNVSIQTFQIGVLMKKTWAHKITRFITDRIIFQFQCSPHHYLEYNVRRRVVISSQVWTMMSMWMYFFYDLIHVTFWFQFALIVVVLELCKFTSPWMHICEFVLIPFQSFGHPPSIFFWEL